MKKKPFMNFTLLGSPYRQRKEESIQDWYERYLLDPAGQIEMNGRIFYRVVSKWIVTTERGTSLLCNIDSRIRCRVGQNLIDEDGHKFVLRSVVMCSFSGPPPEWYFKVPQCVLTGNADQWGEYLAVE